MNIATISINLTKEKRRIYSLIKKCGIADNGIIYGGMVRDEIIATHYKEMFDKYIIENPIVNSNNNSYNEKYWDPSFHEETNKRLIIPNDMDIYFDNNENAEKFINNIKIYSQQFNFNVYIRNIINTQTTFYSIGQNISHKKIKLVFKLGRTFVFKGIKIEINIDLIINNSPTSTLMEPPFNNGDFTSNLFVMVKNHIGHYDIRLSKNTGTKLDEMNYVSKKRFEMNIIENLINGKIEIIRLSHDISSEYITGLRILKMITREYPFSILNALFKDVENINDIINDQDCDICQASIKNANEKIIEINTNKRSKNYMHRSCFIQYLEKEIYNKRYNETTNSIECRCTRRNLFNFKESYKFSSLYK